MQNTLFLTADEVRLFDVLSDTLKEGWEIQEIATLNEETADEISFRLRMAQVQDHALRIALEKLSKASDIPAAASKLDYSSLSPAAFGELCFILGVRALTAMLQKALVDAEDDEDLEGVAGISFIRLSLSDVNAPTT